MMVWGHSETLKAVCLRSVEVRFQGDETKNECTASGFA